LNIMQSRRNFLARLSAAGTACVLGSRETLADEGPPEVTTLRLPREPNICPAPQYIAEGLMRAEGFTEILYVENTAADSVARGAIDFDLFAAPSVITLLDAGAQVTALAGVHSGCYELFAHDPIRTLRDLRGKRIGIRKRAIAGHLLLTLMAVSVGLDPEKDIDWITSPDVPPMKLFLEGKVDAFLGFPPEPQELRARKIGRVILNIGTDRPWSQYFCCLLYAHRGFVVANPVATKRFLRAILKATDICAAAPQAAARQLVKDGWTTDYDYALQTLMDLPYDRWREYDAEDSLRFYALRLHEVGMIKASPNALITDGTDWRFLNELKRELKA